MRLNEIVTHYEQYIYRNRKIGLPTNDFVNDLYFIIIEQGH